MTKTCEKCNGELVGRHLASGTTMGPVSYVCDDCGSVHKRNGIRTRSVVHNPRLYPRAIAKNGSRWDRVAA